MYTTLHILYDNMTLEFERIRGLMVVIVLL